ncbi:MAG: hypothetical protein J6386_14940 [Candidatus Synoicihabitans palmerolidicus]|nr:hypothetical protein [Candidatus Synoicihabitans palmerolidicus]
MLGQAERAGDPAERAAIYAELETILRTEVPVIPLYTYIKSYAIDPAVKGWYPTLLDLHPLQSVWLERQTADAGQ